MASKFECVDTGVALIPGGSLIESEPAASICIVVVSGLITIASPLFGINRFMDCNVINVSVWCGVVCVCVCIYYSNEYPELIYDNNKLLISC